jgi:hypothetical protein
VRLNEVTPDHGVPEEHHARLRTLWVFAMTVWTDLQVCPVV